ncbi:class I adenylate-forming enzyme family protein [Mycolicibacterium sphagni]|uniref:AMP-dependent synthetase n=1 Tax=Mycolicibacterium sphagni TaxID=1786 RepID=A0A255DAQ3_9MYCO|nr:AMP-binding protein [Mycolicibacterium sphagni]OYN76180.1 hypothetical protein CG716_22795 [Mycolicibacterium sphagni]
MEGLTVADVCRHYGRSSRTADRSALVLANGSVAWSQIDRHSTHLALALLSIGLEPGDKVAVLMANDGIYLEAMYGIAKAGLVIVPLNARSVAREIAYFLSRSDAKAVIVHSSLTQTLAEALPELAPPPAFVFVVGEESQLGVSYAELISTATASAAELPSVDPDDPYWLSFTSGTTGPPKAALVTHRRLLDTWNTFVREFELTSRDKILLAAPIYAGIGFNFALAALYGGGQLVMQPAFDAAAAIAAIDEHQVTMLPMVPTMYESMMNHPAATDADLSSVRVVLSLGSPLLNNTKKGLLALFPHGGIYEFYGSTELGATALIHPVDQLRKDRSVGQAVMGVQIRLLDEDGNDVPVGEIGEIYKRGLTMGSAYYRNPQETASMHRGEWITSGDMGRFDDEGYLYVVDRKKDMIVSGGFNVYPAEVEDVIAAMAGVRGVAVIGAPDSHWGEIVCAVVVLDDGVTAEDVSGHVSRELSDYKRPKRYVTVESLPLSAAGKVLKTTLRQQLASDDS